MNIHSFTKDIEFDDNHIKTKVIIENSFSKEIQILLMKGQMMKEHKTPYPILIHILEGQIELAVKGIIHSLKSGDIIALEGDVPHNLTAKENLIVRLTLSKHDKIERLKDVIDS